MAHGLVWPADGWPAHDIHLMEIKYFISIFTYTWFTPKSELQDKIWTWLGQQLADQPNFFATIHSQSIIHFQLQFTCTWSDPCRYIGPRVLGIGLKSGIERRIFCCHSATRSMPMLPDSPTSEWPECQGKTLVLTHITWTKLTRTKMSRKLGY